VRNVPVEQLPAPVAAEPPKSETAAANNALPATPIVPALPEVTLITEPGNTTAAHVAADLTRVAAAAGAVRVVHRADLLSWPGDDAARLAIVPYEALAAANTPNVRATTPEKLSVVTPLYTEEIHVLVRRDSPLTYIHELRNAKISVGPSSGNGGLTAARLYERMFGTPLAPANVWTFPHAEALKKLVDEKSIDAMIVVAGQPARFLADLPSEVAASVKLLSLDREHPVGQRAIEAYLPTVIRSENYSRWLGQNTPALATMAFLITSENDDAQAAERLDLFTEAFCRNLPTLRREGHPKWREVQVGFEIDTGWPYSARARTAIQSCLAANQATAAPAR
jgi:hypothetical protein